MKTKVVLVLSFLLIVISMSGSAYAQGYSHSFNVAALNTDAIIAASTFENEAGMSAYTQLSGVDLSAAEGAFKIIESQTDIYIIGSVALDDYPEPYDVHVYVDTAGWLVAYYLTDELVSRIIDWKAYELNGQITGSKLELALDKVATAMSLNVTNVSYYDFRYPTATDIMFVTDEGGPVNDFTETFKIMVPSNYLLFTREWSLGVHHISSSGITGAVKIDGTTLGSEGASSGYFDFNEGNITEGQLSQDIFHEFTLTQSGGIGSSYVAIVLIYKRPTN